jgi:cytidylate kinase
MENRDRADQTRSDSPLTHDETYVVLDSSDRDPQDVVAEIERAVRAPSSRR